MAKRGSRWDGGFNGKGFFFVPPSLLGLLGVNEAQGALPLGHRALSPPVSLTFGHASTSHLARPPGREKAQGALHLGRRALSHPPVSLTAGHTSWPPSLCPDRVRREPISPRGHAWPLGAMQPLLVPFPPSRLGAVQADVL